ncbi:MAG: 2-phosphosulfolactate phosphatase [Gemmatimonadota bacterium]
MELDVLWIQAELDAVDLRGRLAIVIDVLRASTSIVTALEAGARAVLPAASHEEARSAARRLGRESVLLCGERERVKIPGYDLGNSPREYTHSRVAGRTLVYCTTNGTPAVRRCGRAEAVWLGAFRNLTAVAAAAGRVDSSPVIVCAGRAGRVAVDDVLCAGHLVERLRVPDPSVPLSDGARAALRLARSVGPPSADFLAQTAGGRALADLGLSADVEFSAAVGVSEVIPVLDGDMLVRKRSGPGGTGADGC